MSKNISISDDVYRRLKREKGDRSFSEVIADTLDECGALADVTGQQVFTTDTHAEMLRTVRVRCLPKFFQAKWISR